MRSPLTPGLHAVVAVLALVALAGCTESRASDGAKAWRLARWTLVSSTGERQVTVPDHFERFLPRSDTHYTLKTTVDLPAELRDRPLTLAVVQFPALPTLRAGGRDAVDLEASPFDRYGTQGSHAWRIAREATRGQTLDLAFSVDRKWFGSDWLNTIPTLSATARGDPRSVFVANFNYVTAQVGLAVTLLMAFTYAFLYALDRRRVGTLWLALQGFVGCMYPAFLLGITQPILGMADVPIVSIALCGSAVCSLHFVMAVTELPPPTPAWWLFVVGAVVSAAVWHDPMQSPSAPSVFAVATLFAVAVRALLITSPAKPRATTRVVVVGFPLAALLGLPDAVVILGGPDFFSGFRPGALSFGALSLLQALYFGRDHDESLRRADALNLELADRLSRLAGNNEEIRLLNEELRRQVLARSERLAETIARLGPMATVRRAFVAGDLIDERYKIVRVVGEGGMGVIYEIERLSDGRVLALKVLHGARSGAELARLAREAEIASRVNHPNIVRIVDVDVAQSGALFIVMDYIDGASLDALRGRYAEVPWALSILGQFASGLAALHAEGIVHRDLKPGNVLVAHEDAGDVVKIADFGIAMRGTETETLDQRLVTPDMTGAPRDAIAGTDSADVVTIDRNPALTHTGQILGTPIYMAPELVHGAKLANAASDMYSFGVIAREILTGDLPEGFEVLLHLRNRDVTLHPMASILPAIQPDLGALLDACLSRDPAQRPSAEAIARALAVAAKAA